MSSSEQAPEPTMDEILASIRKIISDDEQGAEGAPHPEAAAPEPAAPAGDGLAEDLANALNDTPAPVEEPDDILDLTQIVEGQPQAAEPQSEAPQGDALQAVLGDMPDEPAAPEPMPAPEVAQGDQGEGVGDVNIEALLAEAGVLDTVVEAPSEPQAASGDNLGAMIGQLDEPAAPAAEKASISEALSAMTPQAEEPVAEAAFDAAMPEAAAAAEAPVEAGLDAGELAPEVIELAAPVAEAPELADIPEVADIPDIPEVADVAEAMAEAPVQEDASFEISEEVMVEATQTAEPVFEPEAPAEVVPVEAAADLAAVFEETAPAESSASVESPEPAEEQVSEEVVEAAPASSDGKTLEDSVKDMLRPMLRDWLDDNMERIVQSEVASGDLDKS